IEIVQHSRLPLYFSKRRTSHVFSKLARFVETVFQARNRTRRRTVEANLQKFIRRILRGTDPEIGRIEGTCSKRIRRRRGRLDRRHSNGGRWCNYPRGGLRPFFTTENNFGRLVAQPRQEDTGNFSVIDQIRERQTRFRLKSASSTQGLYTGDPVDGSGLHSEA